jgi:hypothetical protein
MMGGGNPTSDVLSGLIALVVDPTASAAKLTEIKEAMDRLAAGEAALNARTSAVIVRERILAEQAEANAAVRNDLEGRCPRP